MESSQRSSSALWVAVLSGAAAGLAVLTLVLGLVMAVVGLARAAIQPESSSVADAFRAIIWMLAGAAGCAVLLMLRQYLRLLERIIRNQLNILSRLETLRASQTSPIVPTVAGKGADEAVMQRVLDQLADLNVNVLLSDEQRRAKHGQIVAAAAKRLGAQIEQALGRDDLSRAAAALDELARIAPDEPRLDTWRQRISAAREAAEKRDLQAATASCNDLMALASFDQAERIARELAAKHPVSEEAAQLLARVLRESKQFDDEQRRRIYADVRSAAAARQWRKARKASETFLARYPQAPEAEVIRAQHPTLVENARIEEVRELRDRIRDSIARKQFAEAAELAEDVIRRFPEMAAAEELRGQIERLKERAAEEGQGS